MRGRDVSTWILLLLGIGGIVNGLIMLFASEAWFASVAADTGPFNVHLVRDVGAAYVTSGIASAWAARAPQLAHAARHRGRPLPRAPRARSTSSRSRPACSRPSTCSRTSPASTCRRFCSPASRSPRAPGALDHAPRPDREAAEPARQGPERRHPPHARARDHAVAGDLQPRAGGLAHLARLPALRALRREAAAGAAAARDDARGAC